MTVTHCDLCGCILPQTVSPNLVHISEYKADACDACAHMLIVYVKSGPYQRQWGKETK